MSVIGSYSCPCDFSTLPFDASKYYYLEVPSDSQKLYSLLLKHVGSNLISEDIESSKSFQFEAKKKSKASSSCISCEGDSYSDSKASSPNPIGLGIFSFLSLPSADALGSKMIAVHQAVGVPVGTDCGPKIYKTLIIFSDQSERAISKFLNLLIDDSEKTQAGYYSYFKWHVRYQYWQNSGRFKARTLESVVLPAATISTLVADVNNFLAPATQNFYEKHGIPYRRSYLFYGLPGTGKTSLIQALAGHYKRSVCYLQPTNPEMTDDSLKDAVSDLPDDTILVFEDIDSLFAKDRSTKVAKSALTFSGLLNALDGVGSSNGQIVIMTTNLRDQLDAALIRNGRVDIHVEFSHATDEQIQLMWNSYYPEASEKAAAFSSGLIASLGDRKIAASGLQHFFVRNMANTADEAIANIGYVLEDIKQKEVESAENDKTKAESKDDDDNDSGKKKDGSKEAGSNVNPLLLGTLFFLVAYTLFKK